MKKSYTFNNIIKKVNLSWLPFLKNNEKKLKSILSKIEKERENGKEIFPKPIYLLRTLRFFEPKETKMVILGQDPYPGFEIHDEKIIPHACGLSFSVSKKIKKIPGSLRNIFKELKNNYPDYKIPENGSLLKWVKEEKILLLNSGLTVIKKKPGKHLKYWGSFTDSLIKYISDNCKNVVFLLMGNFAKKKGNLINEKNHFIVTTVHPSPLSANRGFIGSNVFKRINILLENHELQPINFSFS